jgi:hypothetical protein
MIMKAVLKPGCLFKEKNRSIRSMKSKDRSVNELRKIKGSVFFYLANDGGFVYSAIFLFGVLPI